METLNISRSSQTKKKPMKVPKGIRKAEREKLKRDHLNELILELGNTLELSEQNCGKASIVSNATRILRDLLNQIDSLRKEHATLLSESHYVTIERNELKDETSTLEADIGKLQHKLDEKNSSRSVWNVDPFQSEHQTVAPILVVPLNHIQAQSKADASEFASTTPSNVSRPHPRYPSCTDSWPSEILAKQSITTDEHHVSGRAGSEE